MNKYINFLLILFVFFLWIFIINKDNENIKISKEYIKNGDMYFDKKIYLDALENYKKSYELINDKNIKIKIFESYLGLDKNKEAFLYLNSSNFDNQFILKNQERILNKFIKQKDYKNYNKYLKLSDKSIYEKFNNKYFGKIIYFENFYDDVNYIPLDKDKFIVKNSGWKFVNNKGKFVSQRYDKIYGYENNFMTVNDKNINIIIDNNKNIRGKIICGNIYNFQNNYIVKKIDGKYIYITRSGEEKSGSFNKASNFQENYAVVNTKIIKIIDKNFNTVKVLKGNDFKVDIRNNAIYNNKIIIKNNNKYMLYDIKKDLYSAEYEDIDFDYEGLIAVKKQGKWGYIDSDFNKKIDFIYDDAKSFSNDVGIVKIKNEYYLVNKKNENIKKLDFEIFTFNKDGISFAKKQGKYVMVKLMRRIND